MNVDAERDQYDILFRAMSEGVRLLLNHTAGGLTSTTEFRVESSSDDETNVRLSGIIDGSQLKIHRDERGELVYSEVTEDGLSRGEKVVTFEVVGIDE